MSVLLNMFRISINQIWQHRWGFFHVTFSYDCLKQQLLITLDEKLFCHKQKNMITYLRDHTEDQQTKMTLKFIKRLAKKHRGYFKIRKSYGMGNKYILALNALPYNLSFKSCCEYKLEQNNDFLKCKQRSNRRFSKSYDFQSKQLNGDIYFELGTKNKKRLEF